MVAVPKVRPVLVIGRRVDLFFQPATLCGSIAVGVFVAMGSPQVRKCNPVIKLRRGAIDYF